MPIATALIVAAAAYQAQRKSSSNEDDAISADGKSSSAPDITHDFLENKTPIELLPLEQSLSVLEWPTTTVSFYQCTSNDALEDALQSLEARVQAILQANPWLGGWLVRGKGVGSFDKTPRLWYDPTGNEVAPTIFQKLPHDDIPLNNNTAHHEYENILSKTAATVKTNPGIENRKDEPLYRVTTIISPTNNEFALIQSMSHVCGDGHTFYRVYNMLLGSEPVIPLIPQRELLYSEKVMELMGQQEAHYISHITTDPAWMKLFRFGSDVSQIDDEDPELNNLQGRIFLVNRGWVGSRKAAYMIDGLEGGGLGLQGLFTSTLRSPMVPVTMDDAGGNQNPTQSTNDILVSWFWNLVNPDVGLMTVNFRKRLDIVTEDHVGNYANPVPYTKEDYKSPTLIRKSLDTCRRAGTAADGEDVPTMLPRANPELTFSIISNWSSFLRTPKKFQPVDNNTDGADSQCVQLIRHLPIIHHRQMMKKMSRRMSFMIIFSSGPDEIGCTVIAPGRVMEEIDNCGVVKEKIAEF